MERLKDFSIAVPPEETMAEHDVKGYAGADGITSRETSRGNISMPPELFEKLYLQPQNAVKGDLRQKFGNPTPLYETSQS